MLFVAWPMSHTLAKHWKKDHPDKLPFQWGYFRSIMNIACLGVVPYAFGQGKDGVIIGVWMLSGGMCGLFMWKRQRWAWVLGTLLDFNPVSWIVNGIYLKNRWREMTEECVTLKGTSEVESAPMERMLYLSDNGQQYGPFTLAQIRQMQLAGTVSQQAFVCPVGAQEWIPIATYQEAPVQAAAEKRVDFWVMFKQRIWENFRPSNSMNYRVFVPCLVLALLAGALLHSWLGSRYHVFAAGSGVVIKVDGWTGQSWTRNMEIKNGYSTGQFYWQPVRD